MTELNDAVIDAIIRETMTPLEKLLIKHIDCLRTQLAAMKAEKRGKE